MRTLLSSAVIALIVPFYLRWATIQAERQIDKMQAEAFNTPGVQGPITGPIGLVGIALLLAYLVWCRLIGLRAWQAISCFVIGTTAGIGAFRRQSEQNR